MSTKVKICGITSRDDAFLAAEAGADAVGFVLWEGSPRRVRPQDLEEMTHGLPAHVERVGVFVDHDARDVERIAREGGLTAVQLHGDQDRRFCESLSVDWYRAFRLGDSADTRRLVKEISGFGASRYLVDSGTPSLPGGTGQSVDWTAAGRVSIALSLQGQPGMILAGGLTPENVEGAIRTVRPMGVDVATGVEAEPGRKDPNKVRFFIEAARATG